MPSSQSSVPQGFIQIILFFSAAPLRLRASACPMKPVLLLFRRGFTGRESFLFSYGRPPARIGFVGFIGFSSTVCGSTGFPAYL